ncbi:MAG TPA: phosphogluconate dehydrogenase C-terminal domain-containing protein, partial [Dongiaceae bacterium]|nr:phosphogluconate dehydrogenase C-terminal domain-containing protein [Dongiaceae bacterium]
MASTVVIMGAGGKMGVRAAEKLGDNAQYNVVLCESNAERARALEAEGFNIMEPAVAIPSADFVLLAVPDAVIGKIAQEVVPRMKKGATLIMLDAAAAYVNQLPDPGSLTFVIAHPCHPPFFTEQSTPEARRDYFGGIAEQDMVIALAAGSETKFEEAKRLCGAIFAPVRKVYRVTTEQFALLEPAMAEIVVAAAASLMRESLDAAVDKGVPRDAAYAFMAGHARIAMAIVFGAEKSPFSDACKIAIRWGTREIIRSDWRKVFERGPL